MCALSRLPYAISVSWGICVSPDKIQVTSVILIMSIKVVTGDTRIKLDKSWHVTCGDKSAAFIQFLSFSLCLTASEFAWFLSPTFVLRSQQDGHFQCKQQGERGNLFLCTHVIGVFSSFCSFCDFVLFFCRYTKLLPRKKKSAPYWIVSFAECQQKMFYENVEINFF